MDGWSKGQKKGERVGCVDANGGVDDGQNGVTIDGCVRRNDAGFEGGMYVYIYVCMCV